jgi:hypothetical protein
LPDAFGDVERSVDGSYGLLGIGFGSGGLGGLQRRVDAREIPC